MVALKQLLMSPITREVVLKLQGSCGKRCLGRISGQEGVCCGVGWMRYHGYTRF